MNVKEVEPRGSSDFWYDLMEGYFNPEDLLVESSDAEDVQNAISILEEYKASLEDAGVLEEF